MIQKIFELRIHIIDNKACLGVAWNRKYFLFSQKV